MESIRHGFSGFLCLVLLLAHLAHGFYLPGVAPTDYNKDQRVPLLVNTMTPAYNSGPKQLKSVIPYDYYYKDFGFCVPEGGPKRQSESLGSILFGDRIFNSPFELYMLRNETCKQLCSTTYSPKMSLFVNRKIRHDYNYNWLIDGLPAATESIDQDKVFYSPGFPLGFVDSEKQPALNNHYDIRVEYHVTRQGKYRVVGVLVNPKSKNTVPNKDGSVTCDAKQPMKLTLTEDNHVVFTYSVSWVESNTVWATRWDKYLHVYDPSIQWFSLINSTIIVIFLTGMVGTILLRALRKDIARYNEIDLNEEVQEDSGWKLVHGDVFRAPKHRMILSVFLGSGVQLFFMAGATLIFALFGFLSPSNRGSLSTVMIIFHTFFGFIGGYVSARFYKTFGGESYKLNAILTPIVVPGVVFGIFILLNFFLIFAHSSGAVPFGTMLALVAIWFIISIPLSLLGSFLGFKKEAFSYPVRTNQIPRQIPPQPKSLKLFPTVALAGILPFGAIFIEIYYIYNSLWFHKIYYMFGFLFMCYFLMIITTATVTILLTYFLLCAENYQWQWRAFIASGACSFYIFLHAIIYLICQLSLGGFTSNVLYLGYSILITFIAFVLTGSIGFIASFFFIRKIYASIKID